MKDTARSTQWLRDTINDAGRYRFLRVQGWRVEKDNKAPAMTPTQFDEMIDGFISEIHE